jgi:hypothetical protein
MHYPLTPSRRALALDLLTATFGSRPTVIGEEQVGNEWAPVTRLVLDRDVPGGGRTVIVKTRRVDGEGHGGPDHSRREQIGLDLASASGVTPALLCGDLDAGVAVIADLGTAPTLESVLLGADARAAKNAFAAFGQAVGRLHASTMHLEGAHRDAAEAAGLDAMADRFGTWLGPDRWQIVEAATGEFDLPDAGRARADVEAVRACLRDPGPFGALTHLDLNPTNVVITDGGALILDFEGSTYGHIGVDASFMHYPFPNYSAHWALVPDHVTAGADAAYRDEIAAVVDPTDLAHYDEMLVVGAAAALAVRVQRLDKLVLDEVPSDHRWRRRAQLVQQIDVFLALHKAADVVPSFAEWASDLGEEMTKRWDDATNPPPPLFPAFR